MKSKVFGMSTLYAKEENHRKSFRATQSITQSASSTKSGSDATYATSFGLKSKRVQSFRKSIKTLVISKHVGTGTDATNQFWTLPQEVQVAIHDTVLSCSVRTGGSVYTVQSTRSKTAAFKERSCGPPKLSHSWHGSFGHHHLHKLLIVDLTVAIHIGFADHLIDFLISKLPQWNIRHKSQSNTHAFHCVSMFTKIRSKTSCYWIPCLFMNWDLLFDFLFKFENLSNILNQDRKDITAKTYLTWHHVVGSVHFPGQKWSSEKDDIWNLDKPRKKQNGWILGFSTSKPESLVGASLQGWSSRGATLQHWWSRCHPDRRPWRPQSVPLQCQCPASGDTSRVFKCSHCWHWWHWQIQNMSLAANLHSHINAFKVWRPLDLPQGPDFSI